MYLCVIPLDGPQVSFKGRLYRDCPWESLPYQVDDLAKNGAHGQRLRFPHVPPSEMENLLNDIGAALSAHFYHPYDLILLRRDFVEAEKRRGHQYRCQDIVQVMCDAPGQLAHTIKPLCSHELSLESLFVRYIGIDCKNRFWSAHGIPYQRPSPENSDPIPGLSEDIYLPSPTALFKCCAQSGRHRRFLGQEQIRHRMLLRFGGAPTVKPFGTLVPVPDSPVQIT